MTNKKLPFCKCGCGERVAKKGNVWIKGHHRRNKTHSQKSIELMKKSHIESYLNPKPIPEPQLCECGCGELAPSGNRFIFNHHKRNTKNTDKQNIAISKWQKENPQSSDDIIDHHYIYDHSDLSKYTTKMTRSHHTWLHNIMRKAGIKVPHINIEMEGD